MENAAVTDDEVRQAPPPRGRRPYFIPGVIALCALLIMGVVLGAGDLSHPASSKVDGAAVAQSVAQAIQSTDASDQPPVVTCPASLPAREGYQFTCRVAARGGASYRDVTVTEIDARGDVHWAWAGTGGG